MINGRRNTCKGLLLSWRKRGTESMMSQPYDCYTRVDGFEVTSLSNPRFFFHSFLIALPKLLAFMSYQPEVTKDACAGSYPIDVKKRVDFITALPLEIVAEHIVPKMISNNPPYFHCRYKTGYFGVCREWSKRLAVCDSSIKFLIGDELLSDTDWKRVEAVACYMNILFVTSRGEKAIMEFVRYGPFLALSDLTITGKDESMQTWVSIHPA